MYGDLYFVQKSSSVNLLALLHLYGGAPAVRPSGAQYSYGKQKETHELIWACGMLVGTYARQQRSPRRSRATWRPYSKQQVDRHAALVY